MPASTNHQLRTIAFLAALLAAFATAAPTHAQTATTPATASTATQAVPSLAFTDETPITTRVATLSAAKRLNVRITNLLTFDQRVTIRVVGLRAPGQPADLAAQVFKHDVVPVRARRTATADIAVKPEGLKLLTAAQYGGSIVAVGRRGPLVRLALTIDKEPPAAAKPSPLPYPDVTLTAVNYAPSVLSPLGPGLLALGVVALLLGLVRWHGRQALGRVAAGAGVGMIVAGGLLTAFGEDSSITMTFLKGGLLVAAVILLIGAWKIARAKQQQLALACAAVGLGALVTLGLILTAATDLDGQRSASLVAAKPVQVASGAAQGRVGSASSAQGDVVDLKVTGAKLAPAGIKRAGTFDGKIDLNGETAAGDAKATVKAHDWWLWALLAIGLGIGLGYALRTYFTRDRPKQAVRADLEELWRMIGADESAFARAAVGQPYGGLSMIRRARARYKEVVRLLAADKVEDATKVMKELRDQHDAFKAMRQAATELGGAVTKLRAAVDQESFGADPASVHALRLADQAMRDDNDPDTVVPADAPSAVAKALDERTTLLRQMLDLHGDVVRYLADAETLARYVPDSTPAGDRDFTAKFRHLGRTLLKVTTSDATSDALTAAKTDIDAAASELQQASDAAVAAGRVTREQLRGTPALRELDGSVAHRARFVLPAHDVVAHAEAPPALRLTVLAPTGDDQGFRGDGDDLFEFEARLDGLAGTTRTVRWTLGDGAQTIDQPVVADDTSVTARLRHQFEGNEGAISVAVATAEGTPTKTTATLARPGRAERARKAFADRDREMSLLAAVVALGSGMTLLYFADGAWGVPKDYLAAVLWGGSVAEGVKLLPTLVSRVLRDG